MYPKGYTLKAQVIKDIRLQRIESTTKIETLIVTAYMKEDKDVVQTIPTDLDDFRTIKITNNG